MHKLFFDFDGIKNIKYLEGYTLKKIMSSDNTRWLDMITSTCVKINKMEEVRASRRI